MSIKCGNGLFPPTRGGFPRRPRASVLAGAAAGPDPTRAAPRALPCGAVPVPGRLSAAPALSHGIRVDKRHRPSGHIRQLPSHFFMAVIRAAPLRKRTNCFAITSLDRPLNSDENSRSGIVSSTTAMPKCPLRFYRDSLTSLFSVSLLTRERGTAHSMYAHPR